MYCLRPYVCFREYAYMFSSTLVEIHAVYTNLNKKQNNEFHYSEVAKCHWNKVAQND